MAALGDTLNVTFSKSTLKRYMKSIGYSYKRLRLIPPKKPDCILYANTKALIQKYDLLAQDGKCDLYFYDESGFSISSNIPYGWSPINDTLTIKTLSTKRFNVLGFINKQGDLKSYIKEESVKSDSVIEAFDAFSLEITKPTVVVLDNASYHKSKAFTENIDKWSGRGLTLLYLPPYSPELNIIEIFWRFIKYHWMEMNAFQSYTHMKEYVERILSEYGTKRVIDFKLYEERFCPSVVVD